MDYYLDIHLKPDPDFTPAILMSALYNKLHRALVLLQSDRIGVSFPGHSVSPRSLGEHLRLHGSADDLTALRAQAWLTGMNDHVLISGITALPAKVSYRRVRRVQPKTNVARLQRRYARRHDISKEELNKRYGGMQIGRVSYPFVNLRSQSTGQGFALFIEHGPEQSVPAEGQFSKYGLSVTGTVPWF